MIEGITLLCNLSDTIHDCCDGEKRSDLYLHRSDTNAQAEETGPENWYIVVCIPINLSVEKLSFTFFKIKIKKSVWLYRLV